MSDIIGDSEPSRTRYRSGDIDVTPGCHRLDRNDLLKSFFRRHLSRRFSLLLLPLPPAALVSSLTYISGVFRAILSLDLKLHDVIRTSTSAIRLRARGARPAWSIYQRQFRAATGNMVIRATGGWRRCGKWVGGREGGRGTPFSGVEFLGW